MRCPRCGLDQAPPQVACIRCGLPVDARTPHPPASDEPRHRAGSDVPPREPATPDLGAWGASGSTRWVPAEPRDVAGVVAAVVCALAALASLSYCAWAVVVRRAVFADIAAGRAVSSDRISSSDAWDSVLTPLVGLLAVCALVWWASRHVAGRTRAGRVGPGGMLVVVAGIVTAVAGLLLQNEALSHATPVERGEASAVATVVLAVGFGVMALGLLVGVVWVRRRPDPMPALSPMTYA